MSKKLQNKIVVITGASSGIGAAAAELFRREGAVVVCLARRTVQGIECISTDVADETAVRAAVAHIIEEHGKIDVLVNNAGMGISGAVEDTAIADARALFDVNFFGALNVVKAALPAMRAEGGSIINVSSVAAELSIPFQSFYSAAKAALSALSDALRNEVAPFGVKVTCVLPGDVHTGFTSSRKKNAENNPAYGQRVARAVAAMERDEERGMPPEAVARRIVRLACRRHPPVAVAVGGKYKLFLFLNRLLPKRLVRFIVGKMYG